jgi:hypothetical protein
VSFFLSYRPVGEDEYAVRADLLRVHEPQIPRLPHVPEEALAFPYDDGADHQPVLVDEVVFHQRPCYLPAAEDEEVLTLLPLQPSDSLGEVTLDQGRVVPLQRLSEGPRGDVLGVAVPPGAVPARLLLHLGPCSCEPLVGDPSKQEGVGGGQLVVFELITLRSAVGPERLATSVEFPGAAWVFDYAVQRHEL